MSTLSVTLWMFQQHFTWLMLLWSFVNGMGQAISFSVVSDGMVQIRYGFIFLWCNAVFICLQSMSQAPLDFVSFCRWHTYLVSFFHITITCCLHQIKTWVSYCFMKINPNYRVVLLSQALLCNFFCIMLMLHYAWVLSVFGLHWPVIYWSISISGLLGRYLFITSKYIWTKASADNNM